MSADWSGLSGGAPPDVVADVVALAAAGVGGDRVHRTARRLGPDGSARDLARALLAGLDQEPDRAAAAESLARARATVHVAGHPGYPGLLNHAWPDLGAPLWLFVRSPGGCLPDGPAVAVVGTRHPSLDGLDTARALGRLLGRNGVVVVSGLARGIDQAAHRGALDVGGPTIGVLGAGFGVDYPAGDAGLREAVAAAGGLATELLPGAPPRPHHFLARNRIVSGLAAATVVVEGRVRSGAVQTARLAAEQGREVFACPGSINSPTSRAPLELIRDGARTLTRLEDVLEVLDLAGGAAPDPDTDALAGLDADVREIAGLLGPQPSTVDALARAAGQPVGAVLAAVADLATRGLAVQTAKGVVRAPAQRP